MSTSGSSHPRTPEATDPQTGSEGSPTVRAELGFESFTGPSDSDERTVISTGTPSMFSQARQGASPAELGKLLSGRRLGHFELEELIGGGGMGAVFRALDTMLNRVVAVKVLSNDQAGDADTIRRFKNEAQSAARLDHPNIARVYYVGEDRGIHYIVFEHIQGTNLRDLVDQQGPLPLTDVVSVMLQISEALDHASQRNVVHRDIKPSNVLFTHQGTAKLVDMGLARLHQVEHTNDDLTASGVTLGTFDYISPEQARDPRTADVRSDLYSLGCTLYFMLTGRPPFPEGTVLQKLLMHQGDEPPDPRDLRSDLPEEICKILRKLLAKSPDKRYQQPRDLIVDLVAFARLYNLQPMASTQIVSHPSLGSTSRAEALRNNAQLRRHLPWVAAVSLMLIGVVVLDQIWSAQQEVVLPPLQPPSANIKRTPDGGAGSSGTSPRQVAAASGSTDPSSPSPKDPEASGKGTLPKDQDNSTNGAPSKSEVPDSEIVEAAGNPLAERLAKSDRETGVQAEPVSSELAQEDRVGAGLRIGKPPEPDANLNLASLTPPTSADDPQPPTVNPDRTDVLIVRREPGEQTYRSLGAACRAAKSGDVIELAFDGRMVEKPILLASRKLTIRAANGSHPVISFQPGPEASDPVQYPRSMLTISGGTLTLLGIQLELDVPREVPSESWALLETRGAESVRLQHCRLTILNASEGQAAYHPSVAFFLIKAPPGSKSGMIEEADSAIRPVEINLEHFVARGEAIFLKSFEMQNANLYLTDGLLAISEKLIEVETRQIFMRDKVSVLADLRHLTINARAGLLRAANSDNAPYPMELSIQCSDSIIMASPDAVLFEQNGNDTAESYRAQLVWSGDRNFYEGFSTFWTIRDQPPQERLQQMLLSDWQEYWSMRSDGDENLPRHKSVQWNELPEASRPLHTHTPADYVLKEGENPALGAASDGGDVGFLLDRLAPIVSDAKPELPEAKDD